MVRILTLLASMVILHSNADSSPEGKYLLCEDTQVLNELTPRYRGWAFITETSATRYFTATRGNKAVNSYSNYDYTFKNGSIVLQRVNNDGSTSDSLWIIDEESLELSYTRNRSEQKPSLSEKCRFENEEALMKQLRDEWTRIEHLVSELSSKLQEQDDRAGQWMYCRLNYSSRKNWESKYLFIEFIDNEEVRVHYSLPLFGNKWQPKGPFQYRQNFGEIFIDFEYPHPMTGLAELVTARVNRLDPEEVLTVNSWNDREMISNCSKVTSEELTDLMETFSVWHRDAQLRNYDERDL